MQLNDFEELIDIEGKAIYRFCLKLTGERNQAEDLYQQTFLKAMEVLNKINKYNNPKSFLIAVAIGIWKNTVKRQGRHSRIAPSVEIDSGKEILDESIDVEGEIINNEIKKIVNIIILGLKDKYKLPIIMFYNGEMSQEEIARALMIPKGTVKSRLYKGRELIKKELEVYGYDKWR